MKNFAQRLVKLRKEKGYTQSQLADKIGVSNKSVSRWETDVGYPDIETLIPLADALGVSVDALLRNNAGFRDIQKKDLEEYLPFVISIFGFIGYYILQKVGVSFIACIVGYFMTIYAAHYMMKQHTDKKRMKLLARVNALLNFLVIQSLCYNGLLVLQISRMMGINIFQLLGTQMEMEGFYDIVSVMGGPFVISIFVSAGITMIIYFFSRGGAGNKKKSEEKSTEKKDEKIS